MESLNIASNKDEGSLSSCQVRSQYEDKRIESNCTSSRNQISACRLFHLWIIKKISCCCPFIHYSENYELSEKPEVSTRNIKRVPYHPGKNSKHVTVANSIFCKDQYFYTRQRGPTCKIAALSFCREFFYDHEGCSYIPLFKEHKYTTSIRSIAKTCGSVQGEVVDSTMLNNIANKLNLKLSIKRFNTEEDFNKEIKQSIDKKLPIIIFVQMTDGANCLAASNQLLEHAVVIIGYNTEEEILWGFDAGKIVYWNSNVIYNATINVNKERKAETFYKHISKDSSCKNCKWHDKSFLPPAVSGLKAKSMLKFKTSQDPNGSFFGIMCQVTIK